MRLSLFHWLNWLTWKDEAGRVQKDVDKFEAEVARSDKKLANKRFVENAPDAVVAGREGQAG